MAGIKAISNLKATLNRSLDGTVTVRTTMLVQGLIPLFLVAHVPLEDGVSPEYGLEYVFTVNMNHTWTRESNNPFGVCILLRLHCSPRRSESEHVLSCSLKHNESVYFGRIEWDEDFYNWRKHITDEPIEVMFNRQGIDKVITSHEMKTYDLNVLRRVVESLHTGDDFEDVGNGTFEGTAESNIGTCNVVFAISRRPGSASRHRRDFKLYLQPPSLRTTHGESVVIERTTNLNNCTYYAKNYYRKYGDTVVCKNRNADLESLISYMEISDTSFVSSQSRKGTFLCYSKWYNFTEMTTVILEDIRLATRNSPAIVNPAETKIVANYDVKSTSSDEE